jgi:nitrogen fixation NifU-like protein
MALEDLYREVILDHYRNPRNRAALAVANLVAEGVNPLCGDEVTVELNMDAGEVIREVSVRGHGCSISQSSGSMMSEAIRGLHREQVAALSERFQSLLLTEDHNPEDGLGDLAALQGVRKYPVRVKCALLPWTTLEEALGT